MDSFLAKEFRSPNLSCLARRITCRQTMQMHERGQLIISNGSIPTVCLGATYVVAYTYGYDGGRISPTHCALIDAGLGDRSRQRRACSRPPAEAGSARIGLVAGSRPGSPADPGGFPQSRTTPPSETRSCGDASLARCAPDTHPCRLRPCLV